MGSARRACALGAVGWMALSVPVLGQACDPGLLPVQDSARYRERGNRCEGLYRETVAAASLDIIGAVQGLFEFSLSTADTILVTSPLVRDREVHVRAQPFQVRTYYRMDAILGPSGQLRWPVSEVLWALGLSAESLGLLGWYSSGGQTVYVPVRGSSRVASAGTGDAVRIYFRPTADLQLVSYRLIPLGGTPSAWNAMRGGRAGRPLVVPIPSGLHGIVDLVVRGEVRRADGALVDVRVRLDLGDGG